MRKFYIIAGIIILIVAGGYFYLRYGYLKAKDFEPNDSKSKSTLDLRPAIIAKLQQLVRDGSKGLYKLSIEQLNPDILAAKVDITDATLVPDTAAFKLLDGLKQAPDDVYKISVHSIHIDGLGIDDLLHKNKIDVTGIYITDPVIQLYHKPRSYNASTRKMNDTLSIYHRLMKQMTRIAIGNIVIKDGKFVDHDQLHNTTKKFNEVSFSTKDLLIDSSTQFDKNRFMFAKTLEFSCKNYSLITPDSLYDVKIGSFSVSAEKHTLTAKQVSMKPHGGKSGFEKKIKFREEMYSAEFPKLVLYGTDWMAIMHRQSFIANHAEVEGGLFTVYLNKNFPSKTTITLANYPDQMLMKMPIPVSIAKVNFRNVNLTYEEYDPEIDKSGIAYFDKINASITNITNIPSVVRKDHEAELSGTTLFMHHIKLAVAIKFDLARYKTGVFNGQVHMDPLTNDDINPITEPMALFSIKTGRLSEATAHVSGDNNNIKADVLLLYNDLRITPYKSKEDENGKLKKKRLTSFVANTFFIKNNNPTGKKEPRHPEYSTKRNRHGNFFNFIWTTILTGILKTVGIPPKFVVK